MPLRPARIARRGVIGAPVARTAAVVGTAAVVSHGVNRRQERRVAGGCSEEFAATTWFKGCSETNARPLDSRFVASYFRPEVFVKSPRCRHRRRMRVPLETEGPSSARSASIRYGSTERRPGQ